MLAYHLWLVNERPPVRAPAPLDVVDLTPIVAMGWFGVDVFFVLSGFVLALQALARPDRGRSPTWPDYRAFVVRRILRVFPAYYACLTALLVAPALRDQPAPSLADVASHLVMFHNVRDEWVSTINGVFWSLPFEWQFYLVFPLLAVAMLRGYTRALLAAALATSFAVRLYVVLSGNGLLLPHLPLRIDQFVLGMAAAALSVRGRLEPGTRRAMFWTGALALLAGATFFGVRRIEWWSFDAIPIVRAWWVSGATALALVGLAGHSAEERHVGARLLGSRPLEWLGEISYSVYLWHLPLLLLLTREVPWLAPTGPTIPAPARVAVCVAGVLVVSAASYYVVEHPFHYGVLSAGRSVDRPWYGRPIPILVGWAAVLLVITFSAV